jgi:probable rRNA maturation factor
MQKYLIRLFLASNSMIEINNLSGRSLGHALNKKIFSTVAKKVLKGENRRTENVSLAFVAKKEIKKINNKFRKKNRATDVLSFDLTREGYLGEIVICPEVVKENAKKNGTVFVYEMKKVFVHGILHLLGYDHEKSNKKAEEMEERQNKYLAG